MSDRVEPLTADVRTALRLKAKRLEAARKAEKIAWESLVETVIAARAKGHGLEDIGDQVGVSKARIHQMVGKK